MRNKTTAVACNNIMEFFMFKKITLNLPLLFITLGFFLETVGAAPAVARVGVLRRSLDAAKSAYNNKWKLGIGAAFGYRYLELENKNKNFEEQLRLFAMNQALLGENQLIAEQQRNKMLKDVRAGKLTTDQKIEIMSEGLFAEKQPDIHAKITGVKTREVTKLEGTINLIPVGRYVQLRDRLLQPFTSLTGAIKTVNDILDAKKEAMEQAMRAKAATAALLKKFAASSPWSDSNSPFIP